jgi:hypothetical protein
MSRIERGEKILRGVEDELRKRLRADRPRVFGQSAAETFVEAIAEHASADPNRLGARRLAAQLLVDLEAIWRFDGAA